MKRTFQDIQSQAYRKLERAIRSGDIATITQWTAVIDRLATTAHRMVRRYDQEERTYAWVEARRAQKRV